MPLNLPPPTQGESDALAPVKEDVEAPDEFAPSGIIIPPPELRAIVDKTAAFVARVGVHFEAKIREQERYNQKFSFLNEGDAYHAYYRDKVNTTQPSSGAEPSANGGDVADSPVKLKRATNAPVEPPPHAFSLAFPSMPAIEMDVLKLTALFAARKGPAFATGLLARETRSHQFEFLRPTHPMFSYFNLLVEQYRRVMQPSAKMLANVHRGAPGQGLSRYGPGRGGLRTQILQDVGQRTSWAKWHKDRATQARTEEKRMRSLFDEIDWQDFIVVGVVEITDADEQADLPPARSQYELENVMLAQRRMAAMIQEEAAWEGGEEEYAAEAQEELAKPAAAPSPPADAPSPPAEPDIPLPTPQGVKIKHDYKREARLARAQTTTCPVCRETVPVAEMGEHVRVELLNPKYREEREKIEQRKQEQASLAAGADPSRFLKAFAGARTDIFGAHEDEAAQAQRSVQDKHLARQREKIIWDGHANSRTTAQDALARNRALELEMSARQPRKDKPVAGPQVPSKRAASGDSDVQAPKRQAPSVGVHQAQYIPRKQDGSLYTESEWFTMYPYPISLRIRLPYAPQLSVKCNGAIITLSDLALATTIGTIRDRILIGPLERTVSGSKLKLWIGGKPATLRQTLAFWNLADGDSIDVTLVK
ncbi:Prp21p [Malassezia vespertilionis]|uniref:Prp21p n=1 Tax=Malassezia vespertilionis TaxID=2020962 RepID=A0A2N1J7K8_9BASI|nr:Prp21p [Malassezia vespertilionis]